MTHVDPTRVRVPPPSESAASAAQRMQQRLEWERALLAAQPREDAAPREERPVAPGESAEARPAAPTQGAEERALADPDGGSHAEAGGKPGCDAQQATAEGAGSPPPPAAPASDAPTTGLAQPGPRAPSASASPGAARAPRKAPPFPTPPPNLPEPFAVHFFEEAGAVRVWLRDARLSSDAGTRLVPRLRRALERLGLRLAGFAVNGTAVVSEESLEVESIDAERGLDNRY